MARRTVACLTVSLLLTSCALVQGANHPVVFPTPALLYEQRFAAANGEMLVTLDREDYPPHYAGAWHTHNGPGLFCVLTGTITMEIRGAPSQLLHSGQCWEEIPGIVHRPANTTSGPATAIFYLFGPAQLPRIVPAPTPS
ncbi:MAG: cupin domain-containing protein [Chloroflexi bacterium]|nr:cupin domain-containing protein [Chloroflexota bacterium]